uniref:Uncharacterized protein n=1 Tax=Arundo donax TaxID=35708 RepID=A0A0A9BDI0_ARUDO
MHSYLMIVPPGQRRGAVLHGRFSWLVWNQTKDWRCSCFVA